MGSRTWIETVTGILSGLWRKQAIGLSGGSYDTADSIYTQVSIRQLKQIHTATHPARLESSHSQAHNDESARAELLSTLDVEAEEDNRL